ncbi:hypothetical protein TBR22_A17730 [Luteitalea sp. TBR-22]|nr:hypothetical protein TBR22_A17730 [Luteitalea sp. TBR-22]
MAVAIACGVAAGPVRAQLNSPSMRGDLGLKAGSQAPPGGYVFAPLYLYSADVLKDRAGDVVARGQVDSALFGVGVSVVTARTIAGGTYGFTVVIPGANNRLQGGRIDEDPGAGLTDIFVQPITLGWRSPRTDVIAGYGLYVPTGRFGDAEEGDTGLGMWAHEFLAGTTVYLDAARLWHAATTATFVVHSDKRDTELRAGPVLNLEGGVGHDFLGGGLSAGLAYYASWKVGDDRLPPRADVLVRGRNRVFAVGPEVSMALAWKRTVYGSVTARYQWETGARVATEGGAFNLLVNVLMRPLHLPAPSAPASRSSLSGTRGGRS